MAELKNTLEGFKSRPDETKKGSVNSRTGQWDSPIQGRKKRMKKSEANLKTYLYAAY